MLATRTRHRERVCLHKFTLLFSLPWPTVEGGVLRVHTLVLKQIPFTNFSLDSWGRVCLELVIVSVKYWFEVEDSVRNGSRGWSREWGEVGGRRHSLEITYSTRCVFLIFFFIFFAWRSTSLGMSHMVRGSRSSLCVVWIRTRVWRVASLRLWYGWWWKRSSLEAVCMCVCVRERALVYSGPPTSKCCLPATTSTLHRRWLLFAITTR